MPMDLNSRMYRRPIVRLSIQFLDGSNVGLNHIVI